MSSGQASSRSHWPGFGVAGDHQGGVRQEAFQLVLAEGGVIGRLSLQLHRACGRGVRLLQQAWQGVHIVIGQARLCHHRRPLSALLRYAAQKALGPTAQACRLAGLVRGLH